MINFEIYHNILNLDDLDLGSSISTLTLKDKEKINAVNVLQVKERTYFQRDIISILKNFLGFCLKKHNIYLVLLEEYPQTKNRIRTKKGLFYNHKGRFEKNVIFEAEIEVSPNKTLFAGIIRVTEKNIDYILNNLDDLPFAFGLISPQKQRAFEVNRNAFLEAIVSEGLKPGEIYWKNWLKIAAILTRPGKKIFSLQDLNDIEHFRVFYHKDDTEWSHQLKDFIAQEFQTPPILQN